MQSVMQSVSQLVRLLDQNFQEASIDEAARSDEDLIAEMSRFLCKTFADCRVRMSFRIRVRDTL